MNDYEYIVGVDENGQLYIEHAGGLRSAASNAIGGIKSGANRGGKYIMKVATTYGNRYFYTPQEVAAYQNAKTKVNPANSRPTVERITKATPAALKNASNKARSSVKAYKDYQNKASAETWSELKKHPVAMKAEMARRKVAEAGETVEIASNKAKEKASEVGSNLKSKSDRMREEFRKKAQDIPDRLGIDERKRLNEAKDELDKTMNLTRSDNKIPRDSNGAIDFEKSAEQQQKAHDTVDARKEEYYNTPLGKISKTKETADKLVRDTREKVSDKKEEITNSIKETINKIERERDFATAPKAFEKIIKQNAQNRGISEEEAKQQLIDWTKEYYTKAGDIERRDKYLEAIEKASAKKKK